MQVKWLKTALQNLNHEAEFIAEQDPEAARIVVQRVINTVNMLPANPALGHPGRIHGTRELIIPKTRYIIPYRVRPKLQRIDILRVFHTSRRLPRAW
jgi:toxin ParE1/3/4